MPDRHLADIEALDKKTSQLIAAIHKAEHGDSEAMKEFLISLHRPGWTTPAELAFANCVLDSLLLQITGFSQAVGAFTKAAAKVEVQK